MNMLVTDLYDALLSAGADEAKARRAAEAMSHGDGGIEPRVARLEASVAHIERDIQDMKTDIRELRTEAGAVRDRLTRLEERVAQLPGKGFIVSSVLVTLAVMAGLITFQNQVQSFVGQRPAAVLGERP